MNYLSRNKIYNKTEPSRDAMKIYIFCEGEVTEINYFKYFQGLSSQINIIPIPNENGKSDPLKLRDNAEVLFFGDAYNTQPKYILNEDNKDEIWFVIDTDKWHEGRKIEQLREYCDTKNRKKKQWFVAQSNPCFEIWLYYHVFPNKPASNDVEKHSSFKEFVGKAIVGGFDSRKMPLVIEKANVYSKQNFEAESENPLLFSTDVFNLGTIIVSFVQEQLVKAKKMVYKNI